MKKSLSIFIGVISIVLTAQNTKYWQQHVSYKMEVDVNDKKFQYDGSQELTYKNNSPDTLNHIYYHLYLNAFQPDSEMDARVKSISDPDSRMVNNLGTHKSPKYESRISKLTPEEIGYLNVLSLAQDGTPIKYHTEGTILEVDLAKPLLPRKSTVLNMKFKGQLPVQVRRTGRNNTDGVTFSMTQWYPKLAEYDFEGWHTDPYIAREFYGVWGDFDVKISINKKYILAGSGYLQNTDKIGYGYQKKDAKVKRKGKKITWHFIAPNVHDFTWAADKEFQHDKMTTSEGVTLHFLYKGTEEVQKNWKKLQTTIPKVFDYYNKNIGIYPWKQYSFIQGGDGGMEYAMCTLITGGLNYKSLEGTAIHELAHAWFQHTLATNESENPWMDEGFTSYISTKVKDYLSGAKSNNPYKGAYKSYYRLVASGIEEPATTHSDRYQYNFAYSVNAYIKGQIFLSQLGYIIGEDNLKKTLRRYFNDFKMKHPIPNDIIRTAEKVSGMHLGWYFNEWIQTTHNIDYAISDVSQNQDKKTVITLERIGRMPMPLEVLITYKGGLKELFYVPLNLLRKDKTEFSYNKYILKDWDWAHPTYTFEINKPKASIESIVIDEKELMADINKENNKFPQE